MRQGLSAELEFHHFCSTKLAGYWSLAIFLSPLLLCAVITDGQLDIWNLNLDPHVCTASTLTTSNHLPSFQGPTIKYSICVAYLGNAFQFYVFVVEKLNQQEENNLAYITDMWLTLYCIFLLS